MDIDKNSDEYKVVLKFANVILEKSGLPQITDLEEFKRIEKDSIIKKEVIKELQSDLGDELFKLFDKNKAGYYRVGPRWGLNVFGSVLKLIGHKCILSRKDIAIVINGETYRKSKYVYSVVKK